MLGVKKSQISLLIIVFLEACGQKKVFLFSLGLGNVTILLRKDWVHLH